MFQEVRGEFVTIAISNIQGADSSIETPKAFRVHPVPYTVKQFDYGTRNQNNAIDLVASCRRSAILSFFSFTLKEGEKHQQKSRQARDSWTHLISVDTGERDMRPPFPSRSRTLPVKYVASKLRDVIKQMMKNQWHNPLLPQSILSRKVCLMFHKLHWRIWKLHS